MGELLQSIGPNSGGVNERKGGLPILTNLPESLELWFTPNLSRRRWLPQSFDPRRAGQPSVRV